MTNGETPEQLPTEPPPDRPGAHPDHELPESEREPRRDPGRPGGPGQPSGPGRPGEKSTPKR